MRALCEGCGKAQPPEWKAGDLCSFCGQAVRRDVRCFWCAKWVPAAKFCRSCGAEIVEERLYGAARMLKDAGTDRFTVPRMLRELDPDQVENFSRIYQRHAIAVARHVDEVRFLERFLHQKHWSGVLEDELIPQLPWPEEALGRLSGAPLAPAEDLATAKAIYESTPFAVTKMLATLARLRLDDWGVRREAQSIFRSGDPAIRAEAALAISGWRVLWGSGWPEDAREVCQELERSPFKLEAAVRRALLGRDAKDLPKDAINSKNREIAFAAALATGAVERLQEALKGEPLEKIAAGRRLIELGVIKAVEEPVRKSPLEVQQELVEALARRKEPAPEMAETLMEIVETTPDATLRERAARVLARGCPSNYVLRIARAAKGDRHIYQSLLQSPAAGAGSLAELGAFLVENGKFRMSQYGLEDAAKSGAIPDAFVPGAFAGADNETRGELLRLAEKQLEARGDETLHRFVLNQVFGPSPAKIRAAAWWVLHRWYRHLGEHRGEGPFRLQKEPIERFFGSAAAFLPRLVAVLRDRETLKEVGVYEFLANLFGSADDGIVPVLLAEGEAAHDLVRALIEAVRGDYWAYLLDGMITFLSRIGAASPWRAEALDGLRALDRKGNYHYDQAVRRLELSAYGIPEESGWDKVPPDFVPARFGSADVAGRLELLKLAEHQLIHQDPDPGLLRFLLGVGLRPGDPEVRTEALQIHSDRAPGNVSRFTFSKAAVEEAFGSFSEFVGLLPAALEDVATTKDSGRVEFFRELLSQASPSAITDLESEGDPGRAVVRAVIGLVGSTSAPRDLRQHAIGFLETASSVPAWKDDLAERLDRLRSEPGFDLAGLCERVVRKIRPTRPSVATPAAPAPENPYVAKQKTVERMGKELREAIVELMAGPATPEEKMREATRLSEEYQAKVRALYAE